MLTSYLKVVGNLIFNVETAPRISREAVIHP